MACAMDMDQFINCEICCEPYERPQILPCMHTFCLKCVDKIKQRKQIECPPCKKQCRVQDIKPDFRTAALVESYQKQQSSGQKIKDEDSAVKCESCHDPNVNHVTHKCETCDFWLCGKCKTSHGNSDDASSHSVKTITSLAGDLRKEMQEILKGLKTEEEILSSQLSNRHKELDTIWKSFTDAVVKITELEEKVIEKIQSHHDDLRKQVETDKLKYIQTDKQKNRVVEFSCREVRDKQVQLNGWVKDLSDISIVNMGQMIRAELQQDMVKPQANEQSNSLIPQFAVKVIEGDDYDITRATKVSSNTHSGDGDTNDEEEENQVSANRPNNSQAEMAERKRKRKSSNDSKPCDYTSAEYRDYNLEKTVTVSSDLLSRIKIIKEYNNHLYCMSHAHIHVYSKDLVLLDLMRIKNGHCGNDFIKVQDNYFIIASPYQSIGLSLLDAGGKLLQVISHGKFLGVEIYEHKLYAYEYYVNKVLIFEQTLDCFWKRIEHIDMKYNSTNEHYPNKIRSFRMKNEQMYITDDTSMYHLDIKGTLKKRMVKLADPYISSVDSKGNMILTEPANRRVLLIKNNGQRSVLKLRGESLLHEVVTVFMGDQNNCVWVSHNADKKICLSKCTATNIHEIIM